MTAKEKIVGVIGGMGPEATVDFMSRVLAATPAEKDQDHVRMLVEQNPRVPNRQLAMRGEGENPGPVIAAMAARLEAAGAEFLVMPCNLAHAWQSDIEAASSIPFISIVAESVRAAIESSDGDGAIGLLTTPGCFAAGLYQQALAGAGRQIVSQTSEELSMAMSYVERIKSGDRANEVSSGLQKLANRLIDRGASVIIAACTEFPLVLNAPMFDAAFVSSTDVLARKTVAVALGGD